MPALTPEDELVDMILDVQQKALELRSEVMVRLLKLILIELGKEVQNAPPSAQLLERLARLLEGQVEDPPLDQ